MKVRISYTVDVDDEYRAALALHRGYKNLATRQQVASHHQQHGESMDDDLMAELDAWRCDQPLCDFNASR